MKTFEQFAGGIKTVPASTSWYLADLGEARGRQELFTRQAPQKLNALREHALIESAVSSNRIEGVEVDRRRVKTVVMGKSLLNDRDEEEVRGYRLALDRIHAQGKRLPVTEETIGELHRLARGDIWDAGKYKTKDGDIIERYPNGRQRVRFKPVSAARTAEHMAHLVSMWKQCLEERWAHPLLAMAVFNLDFLCIHPFRDGNGREFESRVGEIKTPRGTKTEFVKTAIRSIESPFTLAELVSKCPHISQDMVRNVLRNMQKDGELECSGRGRGATWQNKGNTS